MRIPNGLQGLKYYRNRANITQEQLADIMGVSRGAVAMWETGRAWPSAALLPQMADYLLCSIDDLYKAHEDFTEGSELRPCPEVATISTDVTAELPA